MTLGLPALPDGLVAALIAAGGLLIMIAAMRTDSTWERLFASGLGLFTLWGAYFAAVRGGNLASSYHSFVFFVFMTGALGLVVTSGFKSAGSRPRLLAALGLGLFYARVWWEALLGLSCGNILRNDCGNTFFGLAERSTPDIVTLLLTLGGLVILVVASRSVSELPPSPWVLAALAAGIAFNAYIAFRGVIGDVTFGRLTSVVGLLGAIAVLIFSLRGMRDRTRASTLLIAAGLGVAVLPELWNWLDTLVEGRLTG